MLGLRPGRIHSWVWPVAGGLLLVLAGYEPPRAALEAVSRQWNVLLFIFGLMVLSVAADASGAFEWITQRILAGAGGSQRRLFIHLFLTGALVTIVLSNDATAIALTPIVYRAVSKRPAMRPEPFLYGCVFAANAASFGLPFSNPANVLILPHARLLPYLWHLGPPQALAIAADLGILLFFFRRELRGRYQQSEEITSIDTRLVFTLVAMAMLLAAYIVALTRGWPLGPVAAAGGAVVFVGAGVRPARAARRISWSTFALLAALFILFDAVTRAGFTQWALAELDAVARYGTMRIDLVTAASAAALSNGLNNLPIAVAASYVVAHAANARIAYSLILGVDVGPNLFTTGSLATILWLGVLRGYGVRMSRAQYLRLGLIVVPVTLAVGVLWLWLISS